MFSTQLQYFYEKLEIRLAKLKNFSEISLEKWWTQRTYSHLYYFYDIPDHVVSCTIFFVNESSNSSTSLIENYIKFGKCKDTGPMRQKYSTYVTTAYEQFRISIKSSYEQKCQPTALQ